LRLFSQKPEEVVEFVKRPVVVAEEPLEDRN
jgi:hypothetical protein